MSDLIERQAVLDLCESKDPDYKVIHFKEDVECLPSVSTENPNRCDLISREWLKTAIHNFYYGLKHTPTEEDIQAYIDVAPSISTEETGHWIYKTIRGEEVPCCSRCGLDNGTYYEFKFCPECGAKMVEPQESER